MILRGILFFFWFFNLNDWSEVVESLGVCVGGCDCEIDCMFMLWLMWVFVFFIEFVGEGGMDWLWDWIFSLFIMVVMVVVVLSGGVGGDFMGWGVMMLKVLCIMWLVVELDICDVLEFSGLLL